MELSVPERVVILSLLPKEGSYADLKEIRKAREIIALTQEDLKAIDYDAEKDRYNIRKAAERVSDLPISEWATGTIQGVLIQREKDKKLDEDTLPLYEKFVINHE